MLVPLHHSFPLATPAAPTAATTGTPAGGKSLEFTRPNVPSLSSELAAIIPRCASEPILPSGQSNAAVPSRTRLTSSSQVPSTRLQSHTSNLSKKADQSLVPR